MRLRKIAAVILTVILAAETAAPLCVFAEEQDTAERSYKTVGTYTFTENEASGTQLTDEFVFDEECFRESSFAGCTHLMLLSAQAANASTPYYGGVEDKFIRKMSQGSRNIEGFLNALGFEHVKANAYYNMECLPSSEGVAAGSRKIQVKDKEYTLIALFPRSDGYREEWVGNFKVGPGDVHEGFKEARDEMLRFLKKYIKDNDITGDIKIWTAGHSRGGAVANMTAGFLAGGGAGYLGTSVYLSPEDIYCYTTATPRSIKNNAAKSDELSVSGPRGGMYEKDTEGESFVYTGSGKVDLSDPVYKGIRYYSVGHDLITFLPPKKWGFERYGNEYSTNGAGNVYGAEGTPSGEATEDEMIAVLEDFAPVVYGMYMSGNRKDDFKWMTIDLRQMKIIEDKSAPANKGLEDFAEERVLGLIANAQTNEEYVSGGYQDAMMAFGALFGMLYPTLKGRVRLDSVKSLKLIVKLWRTYAEERKAAEKAGIIVDPSIVDKETNELLCETVDDVLMPAAEDTQRIYDKEDSGYSTRAIGHVQALKENINQVRQLISYILFYTEGEKYSQESSLRNAMTLVNGFTILVVTHYKEMYISWAKAVAAHSKCEHHTGQAEYDEEQDRLRKEKEEQERQQREQEEREQRGQEVKLKAQKIIVSFSGGTVRRATVKKKAVIAAVIKVRNAHGRKRFKKLGGSSRLTVNSKTGKVKVKRGTRKGKYKIRVRVTASGDSKYKAGSKALTVVVRVK